MRTSFLILLFLSNVAWAKLPSEDDTPNPPRESGPLSVVFHNEIQIDADPNTIWEVMMDLESYGDWNPWVVKAEGQMDKGGIVYVDVRLGAKTIQAKHVVLLADKAQRFCWRDAGWNANFLYGQRCRTLTVQADGRVLYELELLLDGVLSKVTSWMQGADLQAGMAAETEALKLRAELLSR